MSHRARKPLGRDTAIGGIIAVVGMFMTWVFGFGAVGRAHSTLTFDPVNLSGTVPWHLANLTVSSRWTDVVLGLLVVALGAEILWRRPRRWVTARLGLVAVFFFFALLIWAGRTHGPSQINFVNVTSILVGAAAVAMVLIFGSLSGVLCERAGVVNIAIEGQFIGGVFFGAVIQSETNNWFYAGIGAAVVGALLGSILAFLALRYQSDQIIVGVVIVTMMSGLSSYLNLQVLTPYPQYNAGNLAPNIAIPLLAKIPILGPVLFYESGFFYVMIVLVAVISFGLFKTRWGLRVRAVGEHPDAAAAVGINVIRTRYINVIMGGAVAGMGGVALIAFAGQFTVGITQGYGYIALAGLIFGRWRPSGAVVAATIFGLSVYLADNLQTFQIPVPTEILGMFPYVITIAVVSGLIGRVRAPAADGLPYKRD
ncbi:MAG TPA: ABC transporter permease [Acidimicrobiales bacterium]|nr:ABC transporter permease [Acidimicrobiales bacterium]